MKSKRILCYILFFLFCSLTFAQTKEPAGIELCKEVYSFLKKNGFSPATQSLVVSGENAFPYNIIVTFPAEQNTSPENLILVFFQEDVLKNPEIIKDSLKKIKAQKYPFTITTLFAYGEKQKLEKADMIYGTSVYLENINTNLSYTAVIFDLEGETSVIETTASKLSSPPLLIKNAMNLYKSCGVEGSAPWIVLSQISSYSFIKNRLLENFFTNDIPAIQFTLGGLSPDQKEEIETNVITGFVEQFSKTPVISWEHHFLIIRLFGSYHLITEKNILRIATPTIFLWILFIFLLIFVNRRLKNHTWYTIGKIWWSVPLTYVLMVLSFIGSGYFFRYLFTNISHAEKIYWQLIVQISGSLFVLLAVYLFILTLNYRFDEHSIDYLLVISCFINQSIFILTDISLSPIFIVICLLSLLALTVKNNYLHIAVFLLMIAPLIPYAHRVIDAAELKNLSTFIARSKYLNFVIPLVLYPVYIVLFRIVTSVRTRRKTFKHMIISVALIFVFVSGSLVCLGIARTKILNKKQIYSPEISLSPRGTEVITVSYSDQTFFDDIIRTIDVSLKEHCILCDVLISSEGTNPILYSDNDYTNPNLTSARFRIPDNPPHEMSFSYGAAKTGCRITVSAVIEGEEPEDYQFVSRSLVIGAK